MKSLFRSIRLKLVNEGRLVRYLSYAIGEVVLIIVGILIALQINDWNQAREDAILEREYLARLAVDLEEDIEYFTQSLELNRERKSQVNEIASVLNDIKASDSELLDAMDLWFDQTNRRNQFLVANSTFDELSTTGNLDLISNRDLRAKIVNLYLNYEASINASTANYQQIVNHSLDGLYKETDFLNLNPFRAHLFGEKSEAERAAIVREHSAWIIRILAAHHTNLSFGYFRDGIKDAEAVLAAIESELEVAR